MKNQVFKDDLLWKLVGLEEKRQEDYLELIASENYTSREVMKAQGSVLTNKYAEGYPGRRYYGGCEYVDQVEQLAIDRAKLLFGADYVNVQPHSGSQANAAAYAACLEPGEVILGMDLSAGGHLSHGAKVSFSGKIYRSVGYGIDAETGLLNYEQIATLAKQHRPKVIMAGFSAYSRVVDWQRFREIADEVGAYLIVDIAHVAGLVAAGLYPSPVKVADIVTSTTHKTLRGPRSGLIMTNDAELYKKINSAVFPNLQGGPLCHVIAAKAVAFYEALQPAFVDYQRQVILNAQKMAEVFLARGFELISGGTDNHLFLVDLRPYHLTGAEAVKWLEKVHIAVNKNAILNDPLPPTVTSGIRVGTPAMTTRGLKEKEVELVAQLMCDLLIEPNDEQVKLIQPQITDLCKKFPVYFD